MKNNKIVIATIRPWNISYTHKFEKLFKDKYKIFLFFKKEAVTIEKIKEINPSYIFFPHWSWIIPRKLHENFNCIAFHPTDLPYGRGGSPLQNLISHKIYNTKISAFKVEKELDSGDVYLKKNFCLKNGSAQEIFKKMSKIIFFEMIPYILENNPIPQKQKGIPTFFKRRKPEESNLENEDFSTLANFHDFIRMLDAEEYPKAFLRIKNFKILFSGIKKEQNQLEGKFEIVVDPKKENPL